MEINFDIITFVQLVVVALGVISASVIFYFGIKKNPANIPLGFAQLNASLAVWVSFSLSSQLLVYWPIFYRTGQIFVLIFCVMAFLHVDFFTKNRKWKGYDLLHAIPLLIYLIDYWDVLILPAAEKKELILLEIQDLALMAQFNQSKFFGPNFHHEFRTFVFGAYWVAQLVVLVKWARNQSTLSKYQKIWKNWIFVFLGCQFFIWFPHMISIFWLDQLTSYQLANTVSVIWLLILIFSLFFYPSLLYGKSFNGTIKASKSINKIQLTAEDEKLEEIISKIDTIVEKDQLFLKHGYSIHDLSRDINIPAYQISKSLNAFMGLGFVDFINQKRIQYCINKFKNGEWLNHTLEAVAFDCGFNNRNSFTKSFKKVMGVSPSEFRSGFEN
ncbi:helix-turn-helix domain-containing protein [Shivajiella indica]|uniref:Helix-turn-helix domain-containing protein n=1 Tax=Shivajiella indica TaxID=872115 RepID=A0ABW5B7T9_9BACT